ncbi:hypothetical protein [Halomonas sp.]|uniref:hypothetical protein n=1 Tax=Halomonas sp. TaxID=1486246 RepID=UPI00298DEEF2|nr:hypothetical protein [Halomonas sp.]MDW7748819.1 hypothetical protein [Halomonas sp.]
MTDVELLQSSPLFDPQWYQERYPDVQAVELTPEQHFLKYGWRLGRNPGPEFSVPAYLETYPDIRKAGVNPLLHFIEQGQQEGRQVHPVKEPSIADTALQAPFHRGTSLGHSYEPISKSSEGDLKLASQQDVLKKQLEKQEELEEENRMLLETIHVLQEELEATHQQIQALSQRKVQSETTERLKQMEVQHKEQQQKLKEEQRAYKEVLSQKMNLAKELESQKAAFQQSAEIEEENRLLIDQLHMVQEELEKSILAGEEKNRRLKELEGEQYLLQQRFKES